MQQASKSKEWGRKESGGSGEANAWCRLYYEVVYDSYCGSSIYGHTARNNDIVRKTKNVLSYLSPIRNWDIRNTAQLTAKSKV